MKYPSVLSIAGSDSGGCAGIQADIKSISACGAFAATAITATTAQSTQGVFDIHPIPIDHLKKQLDTVFSDIQFDAVKIGMLHSKEVIEVVLEALQKYQANNIVLDPVMVATSGDKLISDDAIEHLKQLLKTADLITPNIPEAEILLNMSINENTLARNAQELSELYGTSVLLKGGHLGQDGKLMTDTLFLYHTKEIITITNPYIETKNTHGTGCSLSSSIAAYLAQSMDMENAVKKACLYLNQALEAGKDKVLGKGQGPINHFF